MILDIYMYFVVFVFGLIFGSFANVCIWRLPQELSIISPGSYCPKCENSIPWYYNVPVLSYIYLKGRCAYCSSPISWRYPMAEFFTGLITLSWFIRFGFTPAAYLFSIFGIILIILSFIDAEHFYLPPELTYPLMAAGIFSSWSNPFMQNPYTGRFVYALISLAAGGLVIIIIRLLGSLVFRKEAMGLGDVKLMMGIAAFTGLPGIFWTIFAASLFGSVIGISMRIFSKDPTASEYIPFGPFLAAGAVIYILFTDIIYALLSFENGIVVSFLNG